MLVILSSSIIMEVVKIFRRRVLILRRLRILAARVVLGHDLVELLGVLGSAQLAVVGDCVLGQTMVTCFCDEGDDDDQVDDDDDGDDGGDSTWCRPWSLGEVER